MDLLFQNVEGWPGIDSPKVKDFIAEHQIDAPAGSSPTRRSRSWTCAAISAWITRCRISSTP